MSRQITAAGLALIKSFESRRYIAYKPTPNDVWTIGDGHTAGVKEGDTCTDAQADLWLIQDTAGAAAEVERDCTVPLTDDEFDALVCLTFNIGRGAFRDSTLVKKLDAGDHQGAAQEFLRWNKQAGKELVGLARRRAAEEALFNTPDPPPVAAVAAAPTPKPTPTPAPEPMPAPKGAQPMDWIKARLSEKTTHAGLAGLVTTWGGVLAAWVRGGADMRALCSVAIIATIPSVIAVVQPAEGGTSANPPTAG